jgi:hypothetical protein
MGAGIHQWAVYLVNGRVEVGALDDLYDYEGVYVIKRFGQEDDSETRALAEAFKVAQSGIPIKVNTNPRFEDKS